MTSVYLDHAATSFPKPEGMSQRIKTYLDTVGATINRSTYQRARDAEWVTYSLRKHLAAFFHFPEDPSHVILTPGATYGLNLILKGFLKPGDHCLVSGMEHNAVMRPLQQLSQLGVSFDRIPCDLDGRLNPADILPLLRPNTRLVMLSHGSNVCGTVQDAAAVGELCAARGVAFALDAAQTAGHLSVDFSAFHLSALAVPGHKGLLGPAGIGAVLLTPAFARELDPLVTGGTGSVSDSELPPLCLPDRFEPGTPNLPGIYGLEFSLQYLETVGLETIMAHENALTAQFLQGLRGLSGIRLAGISGPAGRTGVFSLDFPGRDNAEVADELETRYGILTRCGLHCAPSAHKTLGTFPQGTVRFSLGFSTTAAEVDAALAAIRAVRKA
ncbi:aminotransferase class V-fold PLP-dependent enzyme [Oscillibacter sp.]|uniref:aminotransferase class V-fold PLP-dependent enzyme n=1 Tax=Oscillibacter sp. TaxID=1945593 RepID=UPI00263705CD|nr:aminotransferase class V-fold PLP-dependent enzyme [Oscillibacter sp.]MDD3346577.1 aminotransferase class V-fold PLP-dependent enzyme [Oscillibacter sp.]